jgi:hypothetical protein
MYNPGDYCSVCAKPVDDVAVLERQLGRVPPVWPASKPVVAPAPKLERKPPRPTVYVLGITPETVARRRVLLNRLKRLHVGEWMPRPDESTRQMWHQDIRAIRAYGYEVEVRRTKVGGARLACK